MITIRCNCHLWSETKGCCLDKKEKPKLKEKNRESALKKIRNIKHKRDRAR